MSLEYGYKNRIILFVDTKCMLLQFKRKKIGKKRHSIGAWAIWIHKIGRTRKMLLLFTNNVLQSIV